MALAVRHAEHKWKLDVRRAEHEERMDHRLFVCQLLGILGGIVSVALFAVVSWHYADVGQVVPGLTALGLGTGVTAGGVYGVQKSIGKARSRYTRIDEGRLSTEQAPVTMKA
jgi:hypothetical protein